MSNLNEKVKYVVFKIDDEYYGVDIDNVKSIERIQHFTRVPNASTYVKGVINLRGDVVPIIDLRLRFDLPHKESDSNSRIIITFVDEMQIGMLVDSSSEVMEIDLDDVDNPPAIKDNISEDFIKGIGKQDGKLVILIDVEKVVRIKEIEQVG